MPSKNNQFEYTHILNTKKYEWYYEVKSRTMIRLPSGTRIILYPTQKDARAVSYTHLTLPTKRIV